MESSQRAAPVPPPRFAFAARMYRQNLRPIVIALAALSALWSLFSGIGFFRAVGEERTESVAGLVPMTIALGALYILVALIETFGCIVAAGRKTNLVRLYAMLSALTTVLIIAGGLIRVIIHFSKKNDLIEQCSIRAQRDGFAVYTFGFWGPIRNANLDEEDADRWCNRSWDSGSWQEVLSLLLTGAIAAYWTTLVYSYYRQLLDPTSVANQAPRVVAVATYPQHYNPPYGGGSGYGYNMPYAGPPPGQWQPPPGAPPPGQWQPPTGPPPSGQYAPPPGNPPSWDDGGYSQSKDAKPDNPFEDFTEIDKSRRDQPGRS